MISWARERQQQCYGYTQRPACTSAPGLPLQCLDLIITLAGTCVGAAAVCRPPLSPLTSLVWRMRGLIHIHISDRTPDILCYCIANQYEYLSTGPRCDWTGNRYPCGICYVLCGIKVIKGLTEGVGCLLGLDLDPRTSWVGAIEGGSHNH